MNGDHEPINLPEDDDQLLSQLSEKMEQQSEQEPLSPREFYHQYRQVITSIDASLSHAFRVLEKFQSWRRPMDAEQDIQKLDARIRELTALPDHLRDEVFAALNIHNSLILDTEQEAQHYLATLAAQPRIAAQNIVTEYRNRLSAIEAEISSEETVKEH